MKKLSLLLCAVVVAISTSFGQHFDVRAYGGFNILQLTSDQGTNIVDGILHNQKVSGRPGAQFGAALTFGSRFYVQPGFQYAILSSQVINENTVSGEELFDEATINVVSIPLKVGVRLIDPDTENLFNVRVFGGFDGSHVVSVDHTLKSAAFGKIDASDFSNLLIAADFGLGLDIFIFYADMGYHMGLSPVYTGGDNAKANAFYTNIGLRIGF